MSLRDLLGDLGRLGVGLEAAVLLLSFTLAILVVLIFAVRALAIARKLPVPLDPLDMVRPRGFRTLMLGFAALLAPLLAEGFMPEGWTFADAYLLQLWIAVGIWLFFELLYRFWKRRPRPKSRTPTPE